MTVAQAFFYLNGVSYRDIGRYAGGTGIVSNMELSSSELIYMNGTTDYLEVYAAATGTSPIIFGGANYNSFSATKI
jgi:hypothetical protein